MNSCTFIYLNILPVFFVMAIYCQFDPLHKVVQHLLYYSLNTCKKGAVMVCTESRADRHGRVGSFPLHP